LHADLHTYLKPGYILADDGKLRFNVEAEGLDIVSPAARAGRLLSRKGINVPFVKLGTALITDRDREIVAFAPELESCDAESGGPIDVIFQAQ
jgi:pyruvate kinase